MHPALFSILNNDPLITASYSGDDLPDAMAQTKLLAQGKPAHLFVQFSWTAIAHLPGILRDVKSCAQLSPEICIILMAATQADQIFFASHGLDAIVCNHNALLDERIMYPELKAEKQFDAVYNGRFAPMKRHELACQVSNLALISGVWGVSKADIQRTFAACPKVIYSNIGKDARAVYLTPSEIRRVINMSGCGLALSREEGSMYGSAEYLLCGIPVVSTRSEGGRDEFFHPDYVAIVDDTPQAVWAGVQKMNALKLDPFMVRHRTLALMRIHRANLIERLSRITGFDLMQLSDGNHWLPVFSHQLRQWQPLQAVIAQEDADASEQVCEIDEIRNAINWHGTQHHAPHNLLL